MLNVGMFTSEFLEAFDFDKWVALWSLPPFG